MPVGLCRAWFSAVGLFLGRKSKISHEQNVKKLQFYIISILKLFSMMVLNTEREKKKLKLNPGSPHTFLFFI